MGMSAAMDGPRTAPRAMARPAQPTSADPVLLLHGQPGSAADWGPLIAALDGRLHPLAIDRPGWGRSELPAGDLERNGVAALAALDQEGAARAIVVGHSF